MSVVILDPVSWTQLEQVQRLVNDTVRYQSDLDHFGVEERWEAAVRTGDCEDYALAKRDRLIEMGWPPEALRMATAIDERGELHAVLTVDVSTLEGRRGTYVLDNRMADIEPWQAMTQFGYRWLERAQPGQANWSWIGAPTQIQVGLPAAQALAAALTAPKPGI